LKELSFLSTIFFLNVYYRFFLDFSLCFYKKSLNQMLRVINLSRAQPAARNLSLITKRYQQSSSSSGSSTTQSATKTPPSATKTQTASTTPSSKPVPPPSSSSSYPSGSTGGSGGTVKAIVYGVALGLGVTLLYAEYDNGSFRHKVESTLPLSSTILSGLDKIIDPVFGRHKKLTTIISEKLPDVSAITNKLPDKEQIKKAGEQVKDTVNDAYDKLPEYKKIKGAVTHAADQVKLHCLNEKENHILRLGKRGSTYRS
jgi:hypothetical protein